MKQTEIQQYIRDVTPVNILDILDSRVLISLLNGHGFTLGSGISVVFPKELPATLDNLDRRDALEEKAYRSFFHLCADWRDPNLCNQEIKCIEADKKEAMKYFTGAWSGPKLYRCQPLALWAMTYPLRIDSRIVGVLHGGQIIVVDEEASWKEVFKDYEQYIDWETCPEQDSQIQRVQTRIFTSDISVQQKNSLFKTILDETKGKPKYIVDLINRFNDFLRFGQMIQELLEELHRARKTSAEQQLLRIYAEKLTAIDLGDST